MSIISGRYGTVVSYLRLMFWTPRPTVETSSEPNLRSHLCALVRSAPQLRESKARLQELRLQKLQQCLRRSDGRC